MKKLLKTLAGLIIGVILAVGPYTFLHVCGSGMSSGGETGGMDMGGMGGMDMSSAVCHGIPPFSLVLGLLLIVTVLFLALRESKMGNAVKVILGIVIMIIGVISIGLPTFIVGVCDSTHMHCNAVTKPALIILGSLTVVLGIVNLISGKRVDEGEVTE